MESEGGEAIQDLTGVRAVKTLKDAPLTAEDAGQVRVVHFRQERGINSIHCCQRVGKVKA